VSTGEPVTSLSEISIEDVPRLGSGFAEFDRVLGGGFVPGSAVVIGGAPGAGKSTLLLQTLCRAAGEQPCLYVSGEESQQQIASRAQRLGLSGARLRLLTETSVERIVQVAGEERPAFIVIDSIQVVHREELNCTPGGLAQVRESAAFLTRFAKQTGTVLLLIGHVTKDNSLAGPMTLSHIIDTHLMLNSTDDARFRLLRASKNRFGQTNELGVFAMTGTGLREVKNPSAMFLSRSSGSIPGSLVSVLWEGTRPLLVEIQALVVDSQLGNPRRVTLGLEHNRLAMLLAVLTRHGGIVTSDQDVFLNVVGGVRVTETCADLACLLALASSFRNLPLPCDLLVFGEVGLAGEIRPVANGQERIEEALKHGFAKLIVPAANLARQVTEAEVIGVRTLAEALDVL